MPLGELLVRRGIVSRADLQTALARKMGYPLVDVTQFPADTDAVSRLPHAVAMRMPALPLIVRSGRLVVAMEDPSNRAAIDEIEFAAQCKVVPVLARAGVLAGAIVKAYERIGVTAYASRGMTDSGNGLEFEPGDASKLLASMEQVDVRNDDDEGAIEQSDNSLVRLINSMILEAHGQGVSDIHIECPAGREKVRIRFRKDGQLRPYLELPHTYRSALIARLKIMCDLDISERRKPQDGKINFAKFVQGVRLELRVATIPTLGNLEDAVLRLLTSSKPIPLDDLGLSARNLEQIQAAVRRPYGMLLCVGPTGSGKTTTLHSAMGYINTPERKIWTAEDPVEITQAGLRQVQVNPRIDWTFAARAARLPARRPRRHHGRRDPRQGDGAGRDRGLAHRPPGAVHAAHQQRARDRDAADRHGHGPVQLRRRAAGRAGAAPGAPPVHALPRGARGQRRGRGGAGRRLHVLAARASTRRPPPTTCWPTGGSAYGSERQAHAVQARGLRQVRQDRLQRPRRASTS